MQNRSERATSQASKFALASVLLSPAVNAQLVIAGYSARGAAVLRFGVRANRAAGVTFGGFLVVLDLD